MDILIKISKYLPTVEEFKTSLSFREKLKWICIFLLLYFFLLNIPLVGTLHAYQTPNPFMVLYSTLTGSKIGTLATLGVTPIITASIIVHLLVSSKILGWDIKDIEGRKKTKALEAILAYLFIFIEGLAFAFQVPIKPGFFAIVYFQIVLGGILVYLISKGIDKTRFGSGLTLIILAGIIYMFFVNLLSPFTISYKTGKYILWFQEDNAYPTGKLLSLIVAMERGNYEIFLSSLISLISTFGLIVLSIVFIRSVIEIPLVYTQFRGFGRPLELSLFYTSTLPLIFGSSLLMILHSMFLSSATIQVDDLRCGIFGCFDSNGYAVSGIAYYFTVPRGLILEFFGIKTLPEGITIEKEILKTIAFFIFFTIILTIFSWIWVYSSGMDPQSIAESLSHYGFGISGYRSDERVIKDVLDRYIPTITILSGILSGIIAVLTDVFGAILYHTALIILVSASYSYYLMIKREKSEDVPNFIKRFLE
ncbi:MAG: hypothetical protein QXL97_00540 [Candidatus Aenigmatarchaeota archaeon]